jgi:hypothetical protein
MHTILCLRDEFHYFLQLNLFLGHPVEYAAMRVYNTRAPWTNGWSRSRNVAAVSAP